MKKVEGVKSLRKTHTTIRIEARQFNEHFYKASHSKVVKERALHVHQTKTKHFIAKLFAQPVDS